MERKMGLFSARDLANASGPQGNQSTGLWACWSRYGLFSFPSRFIGWVDPPVRALPQAAYTITDGGAVGKYPPDCNFAITVASRCRAHSGTGPTGRRQTPAGIPAM